MHFKTKLNTVILLVGPSMAGKSTFAGRLKDCLLRFACHGGLNIQVSILSSDRYRQELLQSATIDRHSPPMLEVSDQAFKRLETDFKTAISFPVNHDFVIIDTTGLNEAFRDLIRQTALDHEYNTHLVTFEYSKQEALDGLTEPLQKMVLQQINRMKRDVLPTIRRSQYQGSTKISKRNRVYWNDLVVEIENLSEIDKCILTVKDDQGVSIIGDSHEHVDALREMVTKLLAIDPKTQIVHVGDYLDKGRQTEAMLRYVHERAKAGDIFVKGNHESYAVNRIRNKIDNPDPELEKTYMTAVPILLERPDLQKLLLDIWDNHSVPFLKIDSKTQRTVYVTHAPCRNKMLGKLSNFAQKDQRNLYTKDRLADYRNAYKHVFEEAVGNQPFHVFGHVAHAADKLAYRNKIFLDTGAVYGHRLTAFIIKADRYDFVSVKATALDTTKELSKDATIPLITIRPFDVKDYNLSDEDHKFMRRAIRNNVKFISGTMAPASSNAEELEPLSSAFEYYRNRGIKSVVVEPKYMGSRCQVYLFRDKPEACYATSRGGFKIPEERCKGLQELLATTLATFQANVELGEWETLIVDGELLPWHALGEHLIENEFGAYSDVIDHELGKLDDDLYAKLEFPVKLDVRERTKDLLLFKETLALYSQPGPLEFKAFTILSKDGSTEVLYQPQDSIFKLVNPDEFLVVDLENESDPTRAAEFFKVLSFEKGMEGVVVKPVLLVEAEAAKAVPYIKVRNENYLTLVYGYDYKQRYQKLCSDKNVTRKAKISFEEWELGRTMLTAEGDKHKECIVKMISQMNQEKVLDPRL